jgi:hypothetical protein
MTRQTHGLAAKTGLIEALQPAGYEFETGDIKSEGGDVCAALSASSVTPVSRRVLRRILHERVLGAMNGQQGKDAAGKGQGKRRQGSGRP